MADRLINVKHIAKMAKSKTPTHIIAQNKKALHDYFIKERFEAGLVLEGWEVKSIRAGRVQLRDSYVVLKDDEAWLIGAHITALNTASTHIQPDPQRSRKLLLQRKELGKLFGSIQKEGFTVVPLDLHWRHNRVKAEIAIGQGKKLYDKRQTLKDREWKRDKERLFKGHQKS